MPLAPQIREHRCVLCRLSKELELSQDGAQVSECRDALEKHRSVWCCSEHRWGGEKGEGCYCRAFS